MIGRAASGIGAVLLAVGLQALSLPSSQAARQQPSSEVSVSVTSLSPVVPKPTKYSVRRLRIHVTIANLTDAPLSDLTISATRGMPISTEQGLATELAHGQLPTDGLPVPPVRPVHVDLGSSGSDSATVSATFVTTTGEPSQGAGAAGLCQCTSNVVYPVWLSAISSDGVTLGSTETFVPSFYPHAVTEPVHVSWVWPLIDRPHRVIGTTRFTDDGLAVSVSTGRLQRCLQVLQQVSAKVPVTVVIDPELLDELEVMATTPYTYVTPTGKTANGTGQQAAATWLSGLRAVLATPGVRVALTPEADPDIESLRRGGLGWSSTLTSAESKRVAAALGGATPTTTFAWPPSGTLDPASLATLSQSGITSLLLSSQSVQRVTGPAGLPVTLARLPNDGHPVVAALTTPALQAEAAAATDGIGDGGLDTLMAQLALRLPAGGPADQHVVLTPPRYVDPAVALAVRTVLRTSHSVVSRPANLLDTLAATSTPPFDQPPVAERDELRANPATGPGLAPAALRMATTVLSLQPSLRSLLVDAAPADALLAQLPEAVQRVTSSAWRPGTGLGGRRAGIKFAHTLLHRVHRIERGVHIIHRSASAYTLASANSPLPITVENDLAFPVEVDVSVTPARGVAGFSAKLVGPVEIDPHSKTLVHVPTEVQRSGRIEVQAALQAPDGHVLGRAVRLYVESTVLGTIGVVITIVAGAVLALAVLVRLIRRLAARRRGDAAQPASRTSPRRPTQPPVRDRRARETVPPIKPPET